MEMPARKTYFLIVTILLLGLVSHGFAQGQHTAVGAPPTPSTERSRIGLALSGGGALGLTEIGVIKWMEENHIPVDRIAGTSMGAILGSMYASGMSPNDIEGFASKIDWDEAFLPTPPYNQTSYRRKQDRRG